MILLKGGRVVCPSAGLDETTDVQVAAGRIQAVGLGLPAEGHEVIDCTGLVVMPGFVDLVCEIGDPGTTWREDLQSAAQAAAAGGFTTILASPATDPVIDTGTAAREIRDRAIAVPGLKVLQAGALTTGLGGKELSELGLMLAHGCAALSDGGRAMGNAAVLRRALDYARPFGRPVLLRPALPELEVDGLMHEGEISFRVGLRGVPAASEEVGIARAIALVRTTGAHVHLSHVTTQVGVDLVARAKAAGLRLTATVPARSLILTDEAVEAREYDTRLKLVPPLRPNADSVAVRAGLVSGVLDGVCSDHQPWTRVEKELEFAYAHAGGMGLETAFRATYAALSDLSQVAQVMSIGPAGVLGLEAGIRVGAAADLAVVDPEHLGPVQGPWLSRGCNEPLEGEVLAGRVVCTLAAGRVVYGPIRRNDV